MDNLLVQPSSTPGQHNFSIVPKAEIERSTFNRSHGLKTTFDGGLLIPILADEVLPGDTFHCRATLLARLATPLKPVMDNMFLTSFFFFVPLRLLWLHFREMMGQKEHPDDTTVYVTPTTGAPAVTGIQTGDLYDYFGFPIKVPGLVFNNWLGRAYNLIWNEWFRDENLQDPVPMPFSSDGPDNYADYVVLRRGKRKDYFSSSLPWPQKGDAVGVPVAGHAPLVFPTSWPAAMTSVHTNPGGTPQSLGSISVVQAGHSGTDNILFAENPSGYTGGGMSAELQGVATPQTDGYADLLNADPVTINSLRLSFQMQKLLERDARGGTRYIEIVRSHFGVVSPDARLQRPEYLGGGESRVNITPVPQTSSYATGQTHQGNLAGYGTVNGTGHGFTYSATEHGVIIGLVSVRADLGYQQGLNRAWSRSTRYDYYMPVFAHLGEQAVLNKEICADGTENDELPWGYQERWAEYRYKPSLVTGLFRSTATDNISLWHLAQYFDTGCPELGDDYIQDNPPIDRVIAVPSEPHFLLDAWFDYRCARPMPVYAVPGLIDHF